MKELPSFKTFEEFQHWMNNPQKEIYTKRKTKYCFHFTYFNNKVSYLMDDRVSTGRCKLENLYKYLKYE